MIHILWRRAKTENKRYILRLLKALIFKNRQDYDGNVIDAAQGAV